MRITKAAGKTAKSGAGAGCWNLSRRNLLNHLWHGRLARGFPYHGHLARDPEIQPRMGRQTVAPGASPGFFCEANKSPGRGERTRRQETRANTGCFANLAKSRLYI